MCGCAHGLHAVVQSVLCVGRSSGGQMGGWMGSGLQLGSLEVGGILNNTSPGDGGVRAWVRAYARGRMDGPVSFVSARACACIVEWAESRWRWGYIG